MFCKNCYGPLADVPEANCPKCGRVFNPLDPRTYLLRPFPSAGQVVGHVLITTVVGVSVAFVVAFFQMTRTSGH